MPREHFRSFSSSTSRPVPSGRTALALYQPLDFVLVRTPLLPIEAYLGLSAANSTDAGRQTRALQQYPASLAPADGAIRLALAVGSLGFFKTLERTAPSDPDASRLEATLRRYLIRMSSRPTPYGLFAGTALARWGDKTDLRLAPGPHPRRTRLDMGWLLSLVFALEARSEIRQRLHFVANPEILVRAGRMYLGQRAPTDHDSQDVAVSLRATGAVRRVLDAACRPIPYKDLIAHILATTPGATIEKADALVNDLWRNTVLLTDLRPPLTMAQPVCHVLDRLAAIPEADTTVRELQGLLDSIRDWDERGTEDATNVYKQLVKRALAVHDSKQDPPFQVDMRLLLDGTNISRAVADEAAYAAALLLRLTPVPPGSSTETWRRAFSARYGDDREVPLLEMLDPNFGIAPSRDDAGPNWHAQGTQFGGERRAQILLDLACTALRNHTPTITLDDDLLRRLETYSPHPSTAPLSLDLNVLIAATSRSALDAGEFHIVIGPNVGAGAAGRHLGRFADLLGPEADGALRETASAEAARVTGLICAELVWLPRKLRSANVAIRPSIRPYEIVLGTTPGVDRSRVIPVGELLVGVRNGRFYLRWGSGGPEVQPRSGHMLNPMFGSAVGRFLAQVALDGVAFLHGFDWGPAERFPFLPRVQAGRVILRLAQWRLTNDAVTATSVSHFPDALQQWRTHWRVPRHVYVCAGDNRLLLDLENSAQIGELERELNPKHRRADVLLQEVFPSIDEMWVQGPGGRYASEFVIPLVQNIDTTHNEKEPRRATASTSNGVTTLGTRALIPTSRLCTPGSETLFVKLYCGRDLQDDFIAGPLRTFANDAVAAQMARNWFFIRYSDPDPHIRLRFKGDADTLVRSLMPEVCKWAGALVADEICLRFGFDTYDREIERYGGPAAVEIAEDLFAADSQAVSGLLRLVQDRSLRLERILLAVLTSDDLLAGLGVSEEDRAAWYRQAVPRHEASAEYQQHKSLLRPLLACVGDHLEVPQCDQAASVLASRRAELERARERFAALADEGSLTKPVLTVCGSFVHMHCNRLLGTDPIAERTVLGLLRRTREGLAKAPLV
jgi:thiopeptide-type bacteriocin biosynthesis protein